MLRDETGQQAGLADPSLTLDEDHPGPPSPYSPQLSVEKRQLARPADKMIHPSSVDTSGSRAQRHPRAARRENPRAGPQCLP